MSDNPLKAILRIQLLADDKVIAETEDPALWRELMQKIVQSRPERDTKLIKQWRGSVFTAAERNVINATLAAVADARHVPVPVLLGKGRRPDVVHARWLAMYVLRTVLGLSYPAIASIFVCHHTSVMNAIGLVAERAADYNAEIDHITSIVRLPQ